MEVDEKRKRIVNAKRTLYSLLLQEERLEGKDFEVGYDLSHDPDILEVFNSEQKQMFERKCSRGLTRHGWE